MKNSLRIRLLKVAKANLLKVQKNDVVTVYHGTAKFRLPLLINGFDANKTYKRDYNGSPHKGIFVTMEMELAKRFGGNSVIEIKTKAKYLFGTDYSGVTGRDEDKMGRDTDYIKRKYPESFRPYLTHTINQSIEPQALLRGLVAPAQITQVWIKRPDGSWEGMSRDEFLAKEETYNDGGQEKKFEGLGFGTADPNLNVMSWLADRYKEAKDPEVRAQRMLKSLVAIGSDDPERLKRMFAGPQAGGARLGDKAQRSLLNQVMALVSKEKATKQEA